MVSRDPGLAMAVYRMSLISSRAATGIRWRRETCDRAQMPGYGCVPHVPLSSRAATGIRWRRETCDRAQMKRRRYSRAVERVFCAVERESLNSYDLPVRETELPAYVSRARPTCEGHNL